MAPDLLGDWVKDMEGRGLGDEAQKVYDQWHAWLGR